MEEQFLLVELRRGNKNAFSHLFMAYYKDLVMFAGSYLGERNISEDVVQSVFLKVWNDRESLIIETSFKSYLLASVRNSCLDEIRHRYVVREHESIILSHLELDDIDTENYILYPLAELNKRIFKSANRFVVNVVYILKDCKCTYFP